MRTPRTLLDKLWDAHVVVPESLAAPAVIYIDLHLIHEVTSPQAFDELKARGLTVRRPERTLATMDHSTPTTAPLADGRRLYADAATEQQVATLERNCAAHGIELHGWDSPERGIVHVIGPELGRTQPGMTIVCGDSHTATHGAFGALAFGIGTTEVGHVLATQCLLQRKPKSLAITIDGELGPGVVAKDVILHVIGKLGMDGGTGHVLEYRGSTVRAMSMEARMTLCNMAIEAGARAGMVGVDQATIDWLRERLVNRQGMDPAAFARLEAHWRTFVSDDGATHDAELVIDARDIVPTITWGTNPGQVAGIDGVVPAELDDRAAQALRYMGFSAGQRLAGTPVDVVFIGSCTNSRLSDLRAAADVLRGRRVAPGVRMLVVPGSESLKRAAEAEGLDVVFREAGAEWREAGCSMCIAMNGDLVPPGKLAVSTSNRNFEGRQGKGARTILASPLTAAACAVAGQLVDPRAIGSAPTRAVATADALHA
jgi:3-isopropylmalate/(R)-2-methylmalate dehydratase large subunit